MLRHRQDQACSVCHDRIDPLGFALESYDAIGRFHTADDQGAEIDDTGSLKDGTMLDGMDGLRDYLAKQSGHFTGQFNRKLLGYALGRQVLPSDKKLLAAMQASLDRSEGKVSASIVEIVTSRQFLNRRREAPALTSNP